MRTPALLAVVSGLLIACSSSPPSDSAAPGGGATGGGATGGGGSGGSSHQGGSGGSGAGTKFGVDTSNPEVVNPVSGDSGEFQVIARLASPGGKRTIILASSTSEQEIAAADWNLPPVGVRSVTSGPDLSAILICWDTLTGAEPAPDKMPQPSAGMKLYCRYRNKAGQLSERLPIGFDNPTWLKSVGVELDGTFSVMMLRDGAGTFFGKVTPGDGLYKVSISKGVPGVNELIKAR